MHYVLPFLLLMSACTTTVAACDFRSGSVNGAEDRCQERLGVARKPVMAACTNVGATPVDGPCPTDDAIGQCVLTTGINGRHVVDWFYTPADADDVRINCFSQGGEFLPVD